MLHTKLTLKEIASLYEVGLGFVQRPIPQVHRERLFLLGLTKEGLGGLRLKLSRTKLVRFEVRLRGISTALGAALRRPAI
jgi:hypothetical protein